MYQRETEQTPQVERPVKLKAHPQVIEVLKRVRDDLASGKIGARHFDMSTWGTARSCGTVACIGGWAATYARKSGMLDVAIQQIVNERPRALENLFYPFVLGMSWRHVKPEQAVRAIDNTLYTGTPRWRQVMKGNS